MLLVNMAKNNNHWLSVKLEGTKSNRDAIGANIVVLGEKRRWVDELRNGSSYNSSSDLRVHFGLGGEKQVKAIEVRWPNGDSESFPAPAGVDRLVTLVEGKGQHQP